MIGRSTTSRRSGRRAVLLGVAALGLGILSGCGAISILPPPPQLYTLTPKSTFDPNLPHVSWQLLIEQPVAAAGLDTVRVPLSQSPMTLDYYAGVAWTDRAPSMVQRLLIESFENSGRIISVGRESIGLRGDFLLQTELREFQVEQWDADAPPRVRVRLGIKLVEMPDRSIIAGNAFEAVVPAASEGFADVISAFDTALGTVLKDVVAWTLTTGQSRVAGEPRSL